MDQEEFIEIAGKVADGIANEKEMALFNAYFNEYQLRFPEWNDLHPDEKEETLSVLNQRINQQIHGKVNVGIKTLWPRFAIAASIILISGISLLYWNQKKAADSPPAYANEFGPGVNTATLTLASGKKIILSKGLKGEIAQEEGVVISKNTDGQITYKILAGNNGNESRYNTLSTTKGETYQVNLADGTRVWLNAASSLTYLSSSSGGQRKVELEGEGYFEVATDKLRPFVVSSKGQEVEALGTEFNIESYPDESAIRTTLLNGSVRINHQVLLRPNEQAVATSSGIKVSIVNAADYADWKDGIFNFEKESIPSVMRRISRWYNIDVVYEEGFNSHKIFSGTISRNKKLSEVLRILEDSEGIQFVLKGNNLIVKK